MNANDYAGLLKGLLPTGEAWGAPEGSVLAQLLSAFGDGAARFDKHILSLLEEADPRTTNLLLAAWERMAGLPDGCTGELTLVEDRRAALWQKLTQRGGQTIDYYIAVAARLGFTISIDEFQPFVAGSLCGTPCYSELWRFVWRVTVTSADGDPEVLECILSRLAPAHTTVIFAYGGTIAPLFVFDFTL